MRLYLTDVQTDSLIQKIHAFDNVCKGKGRQYVMQYKCMNEPAEFYML